MANHVIHHRTSMRLEPELNLWDRQVEDMSKAGFTGKYIAYVTGLSECQVAYRRNAFGVSPMNYRRGESTEAREKIREINSQLYKIQGLRRSINKFLQERRRLNNHQ